MKKCLSMFLCLCMLATIVPVFATSTESAGASVCKVLFEEDFEGETTNVTVTPGSTPIAGEVTAVSETGEYGQGTKNYSVASSTGTVSGSMYGSIVFDSVNKLTKSLRGGNHIEGSETYGYTVELSADWNPNDYNSANPYSRLGILTRETKDEGYGTGPMMFLDYVGGDKATSGRKIRILDGTQKNIVAEIDLTTILGDEIWDTKHIYRVRFVIKPYTEKKVVTVDGNNKTYSGTIDAYVDGVKIYTFEYPDGTKYTHVCGFYYRADKPDASTLDNIKMIEYYDALNSETEGAVSYVNDDELITAIRHYENLLSKSDAGAYIKSVFNRTITSVKKVYEKEDKTQADVSEAISSLESAEAEFNKVYQYRALHFENFEETDHNGFQSYLEFGTEITDATTNKSAVANVDDANVVDYALDNNWYKLQTDDKYGLVQQFTESSGAIRDNESNITNNYKTELSFDYKMPENINSYILVNTSYSSGFVKGGKICQLIMDPKNGVATLYDRDDDKIAEINLADFALGESFEKEVNRFRFVFEPKTDETVVISDTESVTYAGTVSLYINGIKACEGKYVKASKERNIAGLTIKSPTSDAGKPLGYIDNIELIDYDDLTLAAENAIAYVNRDKLVALIRGCLGKLEILAYNDRADFKVAIEAA